MELIGVYLIFIIVGVASASSELLDYNDRIKPCRPGEILENNCNRCVCSKNQIFQCIAKSCNVIYLATSCRPDTVFQLDDKICICDNYGNWPHQECSYVFQNLHDPITCKPNSYFKVDCNVCRCSVEGKLDKNRCTKNLCNNTAIKRRSSKHQVSGYCVEKTWYSLAPCQFCYCANENKLICNTVNKDMKKHQLGTYNLNICGKDLPKEVTDLLPEASNLRLGNAADKNKKTTQIPLKNNEKHSSKIKKKEEKQKKIEKKKKETSDEDTSNSEEISSKEKSNKEKISVKEIARNRQKKKSGAVLLTDKSSDEFGGLKTELLSESSNEIPVETEALKKPDIQTSFNFNEVFNIPMNINLPSVLDKVFQMALRKSMISVQADVECEPGNTVKEKCNNVCICTQDKKMLCTKNAC